MVKIILGPKVKTCVITSRLLETLLSYKRSFLLNLYEVKSLKV